MANLFMVTRSEKSGARFSIALLWFAFSVVGCKKDIMDRGMIMREPSPAPSSGSIRIGEVGSMTGTEATFGLSTHRGILIAINEVNAGGGIHGRKLELITLDDQGKPSEAVIAATKLITQQRVQAILGEVTSTMSIAMASVVQKYGIPMITPSSIDSKVTQQGDYIFRVCFLDRFQSKVMAEFAHNRLHAQRVAILTDNKSDYSRDSGKIFSEIFKKLGGEIVIEQSYSGGDVDFRSQLTSIRSLHPDVILVPGYYTEIGLIARQKNELGVSAPLLGGDGWDSPKLKEIGGAALDGSYFVSHFAKDDPSPQIQNFIQKYKSTYEVGEPDGLAALGYDSALVLADALKRATSSSSESLRDAIASTLNFKGITGRISIDSDRNAVKSAIVFKLVEGGNSKVETRVLP